MTCLLGNLDPNGLEPSAIDYTVAGARKFVGATGQKIFKPMRAGWDMISPVSKTVPRRSANEDGRLFQSVPQEGEHIDLYLPIIDGAQKAVNGADGVPRVVVEDYLTHQLAVKAANAIRNYVRANPACTLHVSCPENGKSVYVYKSSALRKTRHAAKKEPVSASAKGSDEGASQNEG